MADKSEEIRNAIAEVLTGGKYTLSDVAAALADILIDVGASSMKIDKPINEQQWKDIVSAQAKNPQLGYALMIQGGYMLGWVKY